MIKLRAWLSVHERDLYFWAGLALVWLGVAGERSPWLASWVVGAALFLVAVFGVASTKSISRPDAGPVSSGSD